MTDQHRDDLVERLRSRKWEDRQHRQLRAQAADRIEQQAAEIARLRGFAQRVMECWPMGDVDGAELQEAAIAHGLIRPEIRHSPCGEGCCCSDVCDPEDFRYGVTCYRRTEILTGKVAEEESHA